MTKANVGTVTDMEDVIPDDMIVDLLMKVLRDQYTFLRKRNQEVVPG